MRRISSYHHTTLQPLCRRQASSRRRQHHAHKAAYPRCIGAYNPSPRVLRVWGTDACTLTTPQHHPTATRRANPMRRSSVSCRCCRCRAGSSACDSVVTMRACCHRLPILCTRPSPRTVSAVRAALPGMVLVASTWYLVCCYRSHCKNVCVVIHDYGTLLLTKAAAASQCDFHRQPGGQRHCYSS